MSASNSDLLENLLPQFSVALDDPYRLIPTNAQKFLEIGFGMGHNLLQLASSNPHQYFIGAEPYKNGVARVLKNIQESKLINILLWPDDILVLLPYIPHNSLNGAYILFPDPWPKKRHQKRRLLNADFIEQLVDKMAIGGVLHFASDVKDYADCVAELLTSCPNLKKVAEKQPDALSQTKYHQKALALESDVTLLQFQKI